MRRWLLPIAAVAVLAAAVYLLLLRGESTAPRLVSSSPVAVIGDSNPVAVAADGTILTWFPVSAESSLPQLPLDTPPKSGRLQGPMLEQARVLGAAPSVLRPYVVASYYGESGVDVELSPGIELRFGDASQAARKWRAAAAVLADPQYTTLDYVNLHAPSHPAVGGSGHTLPPIP